MSRALMGLAGAGFDGAGSAADATLARLKQQRVSRIRRFIGGVPFARISSDSRVEVLASNRRRPARISMMIEGLARQVTCFEGSARDVGESLDQRLFDRRSASNKDAAF